MGTSILSQLLTQGTNARNDYVGGQAQARQQQIAEALKQSEMERQARQDAVKEALTKAQTAKLQLPTPPAYHPIDPNAPDVLDRKAKDAQALARLNSELRPKVAPVDRGPVMGSPAWIEAQRAKAKIGAEFRPPSEPREQRPTEGQEKSHIFYNLMKNAEPEIVSLQASKGIRPAAISAYLAASDAESIPILGKLLGGTIKPMVNQQLNADEQRLIRAGKDFTAGVLRKESGAAVTTRELIETMERYFPGMFGDKPELTAAKTKARQEYMETMRQVATPAARYYDKKAPSQGGGQPTGGVSPAERAALKAKGFTDQQIDAYSRPPGDE